MRENGICAANPAPVAFGSSAILRRAMGVLRGTVTLVIVGVSLFGIALGFAGVSDQEDTLVLSMLHAAALFTGLIH